MPRSRLNIQRADELILASSSPRRRELLQPIWPHVLVIPSPLPEPQVKPDAVLPVQWAEALSYFKARSVADQYPDRWVLGADTLVVCEGQILGKPSDVGDARRMLTLQAGRVSEVVTGVTLVRVVSSGDVLALLDRTITHDRTRVSMRRVPDFIEAYVRSGDWEGKAGAYGIQDTADELIEGVDGSFTNVVGLPTELLGRLLG